jgi:hypothetical protein
MKLGVVGSRSIKDREAVYQALVASPFIDDDSGYWHGEVTFVSGGADGVDTSTELIASDYNVDIQIIEPDYSDWTGEHPAKERNTEIVEESDAIVAVWDGHSNGTRDTIDKTLDRGKPLFVSVFDDG